MKPTDDIMRLVRELSRVRFTGADGAEQVARREEDIECMIAEREKAARIEGMEAAKAVVQEPQYIDDLIAEERAR